LDFVETGPAPADGAAALASAARASASAGNLRQAADIWLRSKAQYPDLPTASPASFQAGIMLHRIDELVAAQTAFAAAAAATTATPEQIAAAKLWEGKTSAKLGQAEIASTNYAAAVLADPSNYYGLRAKQLQAGIAPLLKSGTPELRTDNDSAQNDFEQWLSAKLSLSTTAGLRELAEPLRSDGRWLRGSALWHLGWEDEARTELVSLRMAVRTNALAAYQLALAFRELGYFYGSIYAARDCVDALGFEQTPLDAPRFLTLLRFGPYYEDLIASAAAKENLDPLLLAALIRQESLFSTTATSSASARGLMQIIPATGDWIASKLAWPGYTESDLSRPIISIPFGAFYLAEQRRNFDGNPYAMLAAYNAGPGNTRRWLELAGDDPDLFLELTTASETQRYIRRISEYRAVYATLYEP
jgi:soluble lytic murein transglycosylase